MMNYGVFMMRYDLRLTPSAIKSDVRLCRNDVMVKVAVQAGKDETKIGSLGDFR